METEEPGGLTHERAILPRPAVCSPATSTCPEGAPARARAATSALVEPVEATTSIDPHREVSPSSARTAAGEERGAFTLHTLLVTRGQVLGRSD